MKKLYFKSAMLSLLLSTVTLVLCHAQQQMKSPAAKAEGKIGSAEITVNYHQPSARGRDIMGALVPYGKVWRTGANKATDFTTSSDIEVEGKTLKAGTYGLFTIPGEDTWMIIFNKDHEQWGSFNYDESKDVLRVEVSPDKTKDFVETFTIAVEDDAMVIKWENTRVTVEIE